MSDQLTDIFRERFQGHESSVDPTAWSGIQQQLAASASAAGSDPVANLFKERFAGHETAVPASVWQGISSQLGHSIVASGSGSLLGWAAAGAAVVAIGVAGFLLSEPRPTETVDQLTIPSAQQETMVQVAEQNNTADAAARTTQAEAENIVTVPVQNTPAQQRDPVLPEMVVANDKPLVLETKAVVRDAVTMDTRMTLPDTSPTAQALVPTQAVMDDPEKVERIIRELTNEVQMSVLTQQPKAEDSSGDDAGSETVEPEVQNAPLPKLFIPNTFTPNGDGVNDTYTVSGDGYQRMMVRVYSMKNDQLVFSANNGEAWTGENCEDGMYMVAVEAETSDGRTATEGKVVWLTRVRLN